MRLLFDENLSILSARWAAATPGVDVLDARAAGLAGKTDREVRRFAIETDRVLVTLDADFGNLIRFSPSGTPGVIWLRHTGFSAGAPAGDECIPADPPRSRTRES